MAEKQYWRNSETREAVKAAFQSCPYLISFDTETTGLKSGSDVVVELGGIKYKIVNKKDLVHESEIHLYIRPPFAISAKATEVNGLTNEFLRTQPWLEDVFDQIKEFFGEGNAIAAYNSKFDVAFMKAMFSSQGATFDASHEIDILKMARDFVRPEETLNFKLCTICSVLGLDDGQYHYHGALDDAKASTSIMQFILKTDYLQDEEKKELICPKVFSARYWEGYRGHSRVYVSTSIGSLYYDCFNKNWGSKDFPLETVDMNSIEKRVLLITGLGSIDLLSSFKGNVSA